MVKQKIYLLNCYNKVLYLLYDFDCSQDISLNELITIFMCVTIGYNFFNKIIFLKKKATAE